MIQLPDRIAAFSIPTALNPQGVYLCKMRIEKAYRLIREGKARGVGTRRAFTHVVILSASVRDTIPVGSLRPTYNEDLGDGRHLVMLKRTVNGTLRKWHPELTFADARANRLIPESVAIRRAEDRRLRRTVAVA